MLNRFWRIVVPALFLLVAILAVLDQRQVLDWSTNTEQYRTTTNLLIASLIYGLALMVPFMPGVELGWFIMAFFGLPGILAAWLATVIGLFLGFLLGRVLGPALGSVDDVATTLLGNMRKAKGGPTPVLDRLQAHPYLLLACVFNIPGNWMLGGGGGIALLAGSSRQLVAWRYLLAVMLATCVVPILAAVGWISMDFAPGQAQIS